MDHDPRQQQYIARFAQESFLENRNPRQIKIRIKKHKKQIQNPNKKSIN